MICFLNLPFSHGMSNLTNLQSLICKILNIFFGVLAKTKYLLYFLCPLFYGNPILESTLSLVIIKIICQKGRHVYVLTDRSVCAILKKITNLHFQ